MAPAPRVTREGLIVGGIAYVAVAAFYALFDLLAVRGLFFTLNLLGRATFRGLRDPAVLQLPVRVDAAAMLWYNGLHFILSLAIGLTVANLVALAERRPERAGVAGAIIILGFFVTIVVVGMLTAPFRPLLPWWSIVVANALAVLLAGTYLLHRHPGIWERLMPIAAPAGRSA